MGAAARLRHGFLVSDLGLLLNAHTYMRPIYKVSYRKNPYCMQG